MSELLALIGGAGSVALVFLGGTALAFVAGMIIAMIVRRSLWGWLIGPMVSLVAVAVIGWRYLPGQFIGPPGGSQIGPAGLIFLVVVFVYLAFWLGMGTLAGREFREFLGERKQKQAGDEAAPPPPK